MKRLFFICVLSLFAAVQGCKKDIGNYDYTNTQVISIDTAGIGGTYRQQRLTDLKISPVINLPDSYEAEYQWLLYPRQVSNAVIPTAKELSKEPNLEVLLDVPVGDYIAELIVTNRANGLKSNMLFNVSVTANMEFGMMVLYQTSQGGDVDFISTPSLSSDISEVSHRKRLYSLTMGHPIPGQAKFIWSARVAYQIVNWITVGSDNYLSRFNGSDFTFLRDKEDIFRGMDTEIKPEAYTFTTSSYQILINNGKLLVSNSTTFENDAKFGSPADGDYELAPYLTPKIAYPFYAVGYDQKNGRFVNYFPSNNTVGDFAAPAAGQPFDLRNIGKDMLYMTSGLSNHTYAFFKDKTGNGRWLFAVNFSGSAQTNAMAMGAYDMTDLPEIASARFFQVSGFGGYAYYATPNKIYNYAYRSSNTSTVAFQVPAGEEITCMKYYRPMPNSLVSEKEERVLYVATWDGTKGRVYELAINETSGIINPVPLNVFDVEGWVADMSARAKGLG